MADPKMIELPLAASLFIVLITSIIAVLQTIGIFYFRQMNQKLTDVTSYVFHHRHKGCVCDQPGKGDVFIPTEYQA